MFISSVEQADAETTAAPSEKATRKKPSNGKRLKSVSMFARQLHVLLGSGTPLTQALSAVERQAPAGEWKNVLGQVSKRIEEGLPLSEALRIRPDYFDATCQSLAAAGEASGNMAVMLQRLAELTRKQLALRYLIIGALAYPCVLVFIGLGVLSMMLLFVLPRFQVLFQQPDSPLPPTTKFLVTLSEILRAGWWALLIGIAVGVTSFVFWFKSAAGDDGQALINETFVRRGQMIEGYRVIAVRKAGVTLERGGKRFLLTLPAEKKGVRERRFRSGFRKQTARASAAHGFSDAKETSSRKRLRSRQSL